MRLLAVLVATSLVPSVAWAHPHIWISQHVRPIVTDGKFTHVEIEWRFDPMASEEEIPPIDEDNDGKLSADEVKSLANDMLPELRKKGFLTWLNIGAIDFRPPTMPTLNARIDDPASFRPPDWNHDAGDKDAGMPMPRNKQVEKAPPPVPRNLIYIMRFELPQPVKSFTITSYEQEDFVRIEVDKASLPANCKLAKHPTYKSEFVPGRPVFADKVSCQLP